MFPLDTVSSYRLIDYGDARKLESFNGILLDRPSPQATRSPRDPHSWKQAHASFRHGSGWERHTSFPDTWQTTYEGMLFELRLSSGGQVGLFPEQAGNWRWIKELISSASRDIAVLNVFAYTGGATLAALSASSRHRVEVCHVDGAKSTVAWARDNALLNGKGTAPVRWIVDDALSFLRREVRRGRRYDAIILDPPAFGRGPSGTHWKLSRDLAPLLDTAQKLLTERPLFFLLSWHDPALPAEEILKMTPARLRNGAVETVSLVIPCETGGALSGGTALRFRF